MPAIDAITRCYHGKTYKEECPECEIVWHTEGVKNAQRFVAWHEAALQRISWMNQDKD